MPLLAFLTAAALSVPTPYEVQETRHWKGNTVILAAYVTPGGVGHSLLIMRDRQGQTLWKHDLGWKYRLDLDLETNSLAVRTLLPDGQTLLRFFDEKTGEIIGTNRFMDLTKFSPLVIPVKP